MLRLPACLSSHTRNFLAIILTIAASLTASAGVLYYTSFEKTDTPPFTAGVGTAASPKLVSTDNWTMVASPNVGGIATYYPFAGIDSSLVPELDQTAALGCLDHVNFTMPPSGTQYIRVARKVDAQPSGMPVIDFYCQIGLTQSTNGHSDDFELLVYNWDEKVLGGLTFDLSRNKLYRYDANEFNDLNNDPYTDTGLSLSTLYGKVLEVTMRVNYQTNTWTATVGGVQVVSGATFTMRSTTTGNSPAARTFGSLSARWYINATTIPGNNWMLFNDWTITNSTPTIPATTSASYAANSTATIAVTDTGSAGWSMSSDQTWALVSPSSGSGNGTVTVTCAANPSTTARTATLTMGSQTCILTQAAAPAVTSIPATASAAYPANSTASLTVTSNTTWNTSSNQLWALVSPASGSGNGTVTVTCAANPNAATRTATITVGTQTCILTQAAAPAVTSIPATASAAYPANSTASLTVTSNTTWNTSSNQLWALVSPASGSGNGTVTVTCAANPNAVIRTATLTVGTQTCILTQAAAPSAIATLSGLALSSGTLTPAFAAITSSYTASVPNSTTSISLTPTVTDATATIKVNATAVASGAATGLISLVVGTNIITTVVTAQNGTTTMTYTLTVTRAASASNGYASWIAGYSGLADTTASGDPDHDGIPNLLEYVLNGNPGMASTAILPVVSKVSNNFVFTFSRRVASVQDTTQIFQYSTDLSHWTDALITSPTDIKVSLGTPDAYGIQTVSVTIPAGTNGSMFGRLQVTDQVVSGYASWIATYSGLTDTTASGDPDHDGISNLLEYVLNGDPGKASTAILPAVSKVGNNFVFTFSRREASAQDTTQIFQYSSDLSHWTDVSITGTKGAEVTLGTANGAGVQAVTVTIPQGVSTTMFGRLKVFQP